MFGPGLGSTKEFEAKVKVKPNCDAYTEFYKTRPVHYALKEAV